MLVCSWYSFRYNPSISRNVSQIDWNKNIRKVSRMRRMKLKNNDFIKVNILL